ncbi:biotin--[acetyl-CoA-carboxylase] ligase [Alkalicella caledoniensis]|uniref:biotin--[biotin carboxyl-carrier protein] ligase n=1 Tax=Alkalicella caledoniensis TaxID=2731377 RepID=A0A7G9W6Y6_ALKCA|nr:biotin--[acetyl-CoA-carboxylase] ligase [Alkalicella caledoniensis]QNO14448.1 biotin--[acetyl-CoA-carboxylase] ligase [Alkalicella caledoniensis]
MSILLRPQLPMEDLSLLTLTMAAVVREGIKEYLGVETQIKWPNDILHNGRKIAGILTEVKGDMDSVDYVVVGMGINCNNNVAEELKQKATSLKTIWGKEININHLLMAITQKLEYYFHSFLNREVSEVLNINRKYSYLIGKEIEIANIKGIEKGMVVDISSDGSLIIQQENNIKKVVSGDVSLSNTYTSLSKN